MLIVFTAYWALRNRTWQNVLLVVASSIFYGWVHPYWLLLLYFSAVLDFSMGRLMESRPQHKRWWLAASMAGNLGMLGFFKYYGFFVSEVAGALTSLGLTVHPATMGILLPVGISFYTFQTMSYTIDIYRGSLKPRKNFLDYVVFVTFFPQLVAGPIERASNLLPQVEKPRQFSWENLREGFGLAMWGGFKKVCIADTIAPYIDKVFILDHPSGLLLWTAVAGFGIQILADFSGYTDIARGVARMLGFSLVKNFDHPYLVTNTPDFWRRWHMSLSFWIRDYLLVPLLGDTERITLVRFLFATMTSFLLLGLWHGASWNFVVLGFYNGLAVILYTVLMRIMPKWTKEIPGGWYVAWAIHLFPVGAMSALLFRERHIQRIVMHLTTNPLDFTYDDRVAFSVMVSIFAVFSSPLLIALAVDKWGLKDRLAKTPWMLPVQTSLWAFYAVCMFVFYRLTDRDFIYFAF